jgi:transposase
VLSLSGHTRVFAALGPTDMRKNFDTLAEAVRRVIGEDPLSGDVFVFCNRSRTRIKLLCFDRGGYWLVARRLEKGTFAWPRESRDGRVTMRWDDLMLLLGGLDPSRFQRRGWYERAS